jgi:hypothetical protein
MWTERQCLNFYDTIHEFAWRDRGIPRKTEERTVGVPDTIHQCKEKGVSYCLSGLDTVHHYLRFVPACSLYLEARRVTLCSSTMKMEAATLFETSVMIYQGHGVIYERTVIFIFTTVRTTFSGLLRCRPLTL